jgi:[acyl-carrier-protein] S-malonyltransferase
MTGRLSDVAVVFPGESGAISGMADAWLTDEHARAVIDEASDIVGRDVAQWWRDPLNLCDPAAAHVEVVVTGIAGYRSLIHHGLRPVVVAGHGVGEYSALVAAGALGFGQVVELVHERAELLALSPHADCAGMAAVIGPDAGEVARAVVAQVADGGPLAVGSVDGPGQVVLSGGREEIAWARDAVVAAGLTMIRLPGRAACHGPLMRPVAAHLAVPLAGLDWSVPDVPVVPNVDARPTRDPDRLARCLREHLTSPVQWEATSRALVEAGATSVVEVGAVPVLAPLIHQVHPDLPVRLASGPGVPFATEPLPEPALAGPATTRGVT